MTTLGGLAPPGLPCAFPKTYDGVAYTEEGGCIPGPYPFAASAWTNEHAGFCFTSQGVWGNCACDVAAVVAHQAALEEELLLCLEEISCDPTIWEDYERYESLTLIESIVALAGNPVRAVVPGSVSVLIYRYISRESCSQFDSLPLTSLTNSSARC